MARSLLNRVRISEFEKGIHDNVVLSKIDINDRKGSNGIINKMVYLTFTKVDENGKRLAESELAWWKPDPTSDYFVTNLQELSLQLHNLVHVHLGDEEAAFDVFKTVFDDIDVKSVEDIHNKKWKQSDVKILLNNYKNAFNEVMKDKLKTVKFRLKLTTNYKGEGVEIPKYGKFVEPMDVDTTELKFSASELKIHAKQGNVEVKETNSTKIEGTI